jgi:hypothetical protein
MPLARSMGFHSIILKLLLPIRSVASAPASIAVLRMALTRFVPRSDVHQTACHDDIDPRPGRLCYTLTLRDGIDEKYTNDTRIINLITQGMEVRQKFAIPGHTMARDADLRS